MNKESNKQILVKNKQVKTKKQEEKLKKKKINVSSDDDDDDDDDETYVPSSEDESEMDDEEYRKFLHKMFPSKYLEKKIKAGETFKKKVSKLKEEHFVDDEEEPDTRKKSQKNKNEQSQKKKHTKQQEEEETWETEEEEEEEKLPKKLKKRKPKTKMESESEEDIISTANSKKKSSNKFNIIFTIGGENEEDEYEDWDDDDYEDTENEDESVSSSSNSEEDEEEELEEFKPSKKNSSKYLSEVNTKDIKNDNKIVEDDFLIQLKEIYEKNKNNPLVQKCIDVCEENIQKTKEKVLKKEKKHKAKNLRIFRKIVKDKNTMNDFAFFEKLAIEEQKKIIKELREINQIMRVEKPYRMTLLESSIPTVFKSAAMKKINSLRYMEPGTGEYYKIKNWVDTFMRIPFNQYKQLPVTIEDGVDKCHEFMQNAQTILNESSYGLNDAKMQIMQMVGQLITNPKSIGTAIAIHGPPGTGKTTLLKEGVSKILNRPFAFIALGGATDSSFLEGHSYTYEGSTWGRIIQILIDSKCMNPVIYFDELDKISDTPRGEEITGILTHLTDTSQNSQFHDKYFSEIDFDLSKCLFIFSYNDESKVNPILKDRMYRIQTKGYNLKQKTVICNDYLIPKIREQVKFAEDQIIIPDETIHYIIENHCNKEDGVRNIKRCLEIIHTKLNLYRLMKSDSNLFEEDMSLKVQFPYTVTKDIVDKLIKLDKGNMSALYSMYV